MKEHQLRTRPYLLFPYLPLPAPLNHAPLLSTVPVIHKTLLVSSFSTQISLGTSTPVSSTPRNLKQSPPRDLVRPRAVDLDPLNVCAADEVLEEDVMAQAKQVAGVEEKGACPDG